MDPRVLPHSEEGVRLAAELLAAVAQATASDSSLEAGATGALVLALLTSDCSSLCGEGEKGSPEQAERLFRSARAALDACCAARAAGEQGWPVRGYEPLRAWLADQATDLTVRPTLDTEASDEDSLAATDEEEDVPGSERPAGDGGGGGGGSGGSEQHAGGASDAEQQGELDHSEVLHRLLYIGPATLVCLSRACSRGTDAAALAAGMEAVALLLVLVPAGHWEDRIVQGAWKLLSLDCYCLGPEFTAACSGSNGGTGSSRSTGNKKHGHGQKRLAGAAGRGGHSSSSFEDGWSQQPGGERAFDSVLFSWTLLVAWLPGKRDSALLPSADVVRRAAQMFRAADLPAMQRMRAGLMLGVAHCWMLRSQEASEAGWRMMDMQSERGQLLSAVAWALQPDQLRLLGQVKDSERHVKSSLIRMAHDALLLMSSTRTLSSCSTEMHQFQSQLVRVARDALEELPPVAEDADEAAARYMELAKACTGASGVCTTPGTIEELLSRCCMAITMLVAVQPRQALVDDGRMRSIVQELMWRCPGHELLQSAASTMWKLLDKLERDEQEAGPESSLWDLGIMLLAVLGSYGVFLQRLAPADRAEQYSLCGALLAICRCMRFTDAAASKGVEAVCDLIRTIARLPGMQPPLQLWMLLSVVQELANSGHKARQTLAEADIGVETCMGMVAAVRMVAEQPHNFRGEEASWEGRIASEAAFSVEHNTWASGSMLLDQLHKKNAAPALLRALCQPGLPANLHCRIITCCMTVLARLADGYPGVKAKVVQSGVVQKLVIPHLRMALEEHTHAPVANRGSGISAVRLGSSALSIAFDPELRRELGINPSDHNSGGGGSGGGSDSRKGKTGSNGGAEPFIIPDTSKLGFFWAELYELTLETALAQWATAAHDDCLWVDHWKHEAAKTAMDCIRLTQAYDPAVWVSFLEKRAVQRLPEVGRLAKWSLHEVAAFGRWHFEVHGSECVGCMHTFAGMSWCVADLVERCLAHSTLLLCLLRHGLVTELREAADILELHFSGVEEFDTMKQDCRRIADALAAAEAQHPPAASQKLRQLRRQLLDTLSDRELGPLFMEMQREGRGQDEEAAAAAAAEQAAAAAAEQAAAALLQEEEAAEQRRKQQEQKRAEAAAKQRQAAAAAEARRRQQEEAEEARRRQQEEEKAQRERLRREAAEQARRQREAEEAAAAERLRQEAQKAAAEEATRQAAAEAARRQQAEAAAALAAARQAALEEARKRREKAEAAEQQRRQAAEAAAAETARQQAVAKQAAAAEEAARQAAEAAAAAEQQRGAARDTATEQTPLPALEAALAAVHLGTTAGAAGAAASQGAAPVAASMPPAAPQRAPPPLPAVPGAARRQYRPLLHQQQTQQAQQGSTADSSASSSGASPSGSAAPSQAASAATSQAASPLPVPSLSPPSMHSLLAQMLPSEAGKAAGAAAGTATAGATAAGRAAPPPATPALISGLGAAQMGSPTRPAAVAAAPAPGRLASAASQQQQRQGQPAMAAVLQAMLPPTVPRPAARPAAVLAAMLPKPSVPAAPAAAATRQQRAASPQLARQQQQHGEQLGEWPQQEQAVPKLAAAPQAAPPQQAQQQAQQEAVLECCVCLHHEPTVVAVPCGHRSLCAGCAAACWKAGHRDCPICRHKLEGLLDPSKGLIC